MLLWRIASIQEVIFTYKTNNYYLDRAKSVSAFVQQFNLSLMCLLIEIVSTSTVSITASFKGIVSGVKFVQGECSSRNVLLMGIYLTYYSTYTVYIYMCTIYFFSSGRHVRMNEVCINFNITSIYIILLGINILWFSHSNLLMWSGYHIVWFVLRPALFFLVVRSFRPRSTKPCNTAVT